MRGEKLDACTTKLGKDPDDSFLGQEPVVEAESDVNSSVAKRLLLGKLKDMSHAGLWHDVSRELTALCVPFGEVRWVGVCEYGADPRRDGCG